MAYDAEKESRIEDLVIERNRLEEQYEACEFLLNAALNVSESMRLSHTLEKIQEKMDYLDEEVEIVDNGATWQWIANAGWREPTDYEPYPQSVVAEESPPSTNLPKL